MVLLQKTVVREWAFMEKFFGISPNPLESSSYVCDIERIEGLSVGNNGQNSSLAICSLLTHDAEIATFDSQRTYSFLKA